MTVNPADFMDRLAAIRLENVFNPYADHCALHDRNDAVAWRRRNLETGLEAAIELDIRTIWIGRDLGYLGGRRTGLALTDEIHLDAYSAMFGGVPVVKATTGPAASENTARTIWQMLARIAQPVFLWNVFPLHPHMAGHPISNRCHTAIERSACSAFLGDIIKLLQPDRVLAVGKDANKAASKLGIASTPVRHPSHGGRNVFIEHIENAHDLE